MIIASFYWEINLKYPQMKAYIRMLDYLRLLILGHQDDERSHQKS